MSALATPRRIGLAVGLVLMLTLVVLLVQPANLPTTRSLQSNEAAWSLPASVTVDGDAALSTITQRRLWAQAMPPGLAGLVPGSEEPSLTAPDWRVAGVFTEGGRYAVLVSTAGQFMPKSFYVGDSLPGGARILAISRERISLSLNGQRLALSTYPQ